MDWLGLPGVEVGLSRSLSFCITSMILILLVVVHNFLLGLLCLWMAQKMWRWRRSLSRLSIRLADTEHVVYSLLQPAPHGIQQVQRQTSQWRQHYEQLGVQAAQMQQILRLLSLLQVLWPYRSWLGQFRRSRGTLVDRIPTPPEGLTPGINAKPGSLR